MDDPANPPPAILARIDGSEIAYRASPARYSANHRPGLIFLGGFMSDMSGTKATALEAFARRRGQAFVRFDYLGHGQSSGGFAEGTIGRWAEDATAVIDEATEGPQVLIGSSMGGWIMLLAALARPERVAGLVGIAAAPDFTEDLMWARYGPEARAALLETGVHHEPSDHSDTPTPITPRLIEEARSHLLLRGPIPLTCPVRLIHGLRDPDVPWQTSLRLAEALESHDVELILVKDGDHRLSGPEDLERLFRAVARLSDARLSDALPCSADYGPLGRRRKRCAPKCRSKRRARRLAAEGVTPGAAAASQELPRRPPASKVPSQLGGGIVCLVPRPCL